MTDAEGFNTNEVVIRVENIWGEQVRAYMAEQDRRFFHGMIGESWRYNDRNPFPKLAWWPWIDRAVWWRKNGRREVSQRVRHAVDALKGIERDGCDW